MPIGTTIIGGVAIAGLSTAVVYGLWKNSGTDDPQADYYDRTETTIGDTYDGGTESGTEDLTLASGGTPSVDESFEELVGHPVPPANVSSIGTNLESIKGIGSTRAETLREDGFETATDIYRTDDSELLNVHGLGERAVRQIREDVGVAATAESQVEFESPHDDAESGSEAEQNDNDGEDSDGDEPSQNDGETLDDHAEGDVPATTRTVERDDSSTDE